MGPAELSGLADTRLRSSGLALRFFRRLADYISVPGSVFAICIALILLIIPLTTLYNRLTVSIAELRDAEQQDFFFVMSQARSFGTDLKTKPQAGQDLQNSLKKLRELESKINVNNLVINSTVDLSTGTPRWYPVLIAAYGFGPSLAAAIARPVETPRAATTPAASSDPATAPMPPSGPNKPAPATPSFADPGASAAAPPACAAEDEACQNRHFTLVYGINLIAPDVSAAYLNRRQAESAVALLAGSMLPVLYGLLGAAVYLLRRYLAENQSAAKIDPNLGMRAFLRLGLGGIAGLAIGWFWTPTTAKGALDVANLSTAPFALAFLGGFSIELLFSILDRILAAVNPSTDVTKLEKKAP